jgi:hypothetical protein
MTALDKFHQYLNMQRRDRKGRFTTDNPKSIIMRVTEEEQQLILRFRQIKSPELNENDQFYKDMRELIHKRMKNLELEF